MALRAETETTQTLAKKSPRTNKAFTLIEMTIVITVLAILAAVIMPNLFSESRSRDARQFFSKARNLMLEARSRAIGDGVARSVRVDESGARLVVEKVDAESGDVTEEKTLAMPDGVTGSTYRMQKQESNSSEWYVRFYGDGRARGGAVSFDSAGRKYSIIVEDTGAVKRLDGDLPAVEEDTWDAGGYEQRV
jgi:prepilin-type N-terminal cleavage/methylation domain-containing protein